MGILALTADGRRLLIKTYYLWRSLVGVEIGLRGLAQIVVVTFFPAAMVAFTTSIGKAERFDWELFWLVLVFIMAAGVLSNVVNMSTTLTSVLSPRAGTVWSNDRKVLVAGVLKKVTREVQAKRADPRVVAKLVTDLLTVIVSHVRDFRGSHSKDRPDVFANLLLIDGDQLVVVARDASAHTTNFSREIPKRYPKASMLSGRACEARRPLTIGDLASERPEAPQNKPYASILAIPLVSNDDQDVVGVLSIDSSRPYFFESFRPGEVANDLENSLQPYIHTLMLILERLVDPSPAGLVQQLAGGLKPEAIHDDGATA